MKIFNKSGGFTIIEILVAINISAISITLVIVFYLFTVKFFSKSAKEQELNWNNNRFFYLLNRTLRNSSTFSILTESNSISLIASRRDTILIKQDRIILKNLYSIKDLEKISLLIKSHNKLQLEYEDGKVIFNYTGSFPNNKLKLDEIDIDIKSAHFSHSFKYLSPAISANKFNDLDEN